jgi:hypothetical protein
LDPASFTSFLLFAFFTNDFLSSLINVGRSSSSNAPPSSCPHTPHRQTTFSHALHAYPVSLSN